MKTTQLIKTVCTLLVMGVTLGGCSKKEILDPLGNGQSTISMEIDGQPWTAQLTTLFTEDHSDYDKQPVYSVVINGSKTSDVDETVQSISFLFDIPAAKFKNPKGSYPTAGTELHDGKVMVAFVDTRNSDENSVFAATSGTLEITGFETGKQNVVGQQTNIEGYTKLSGTFQMKLKSTGGGDKTVNITNGKFNLSGAFKVAY